MPNPSMGAAAALAALAFALPGDPPWFTELEPARQARLRADFARAAELARQQTGQTRRGVRLAAAVEDGWQQIEQGRYANAAAALDQARLAAQSTLGADHPVFALALAGLASLERRHGPLAGAEEKLERAAGVLEETVGTRHPAFGGAMLERARLRRALGRLRESRADAESALAAFGSASPVEAAAAWQELAETELAAGNMPGARTGIGRALQAWETAAGPVHPGHAASLAVRAELAFMAGEHFEAESLAMQALAVRDKTLGAGHPESAGAVALLARISLALKNPAEADRLARRIEESFRMSGGTFTPAWTGPLQTAAEVHLAAGDQASAAQLLAAVRQARARANLSLAGGRRVESLLHLGNQQPGEARQAQAEYLSALEALSAGHGEIPAAAAAMASIEMMEGRFAEAERLLAKAIGVAEASYGGGVRLLNWLHRMHAQTLAAQGRAPEALLPIDNSLRILERGRGMADPEWAPTLHTYAGLLRQTGRTREAAEMERRATAGR